MRDIIQLALFGPADAFGMGMIPKHLIGEIKFRPNTNGCLDYANVEASANWNVEPNRSQDVHQGRSAFEGTERDVVWGDEEMPLDIYSECLTRTATTDGRISLTFTPLEGDSVGGAVLGKGRLPCLKFKALISASWDDVPHLTAEMKDELLSAYPEHERDARTKGIPQLGSGLIYPVPDELITCEPFPIPKHWPRFGRDGLRMGSPTSVVWGP